MQVVRNWSVIDGLPFGPSVRALLLSPANDGAVGKRLSGLCARVEHLDEMFSALDAILSDPADYSLFVMDADAFGGLDAGLRAFRLLGDVANRVPMVVVTAECDAHVFPEANEGPTVLSDPHGVSSLRAGLDHALRSRLSLRA